MNGMSIVRTRRAAGPPRTAIAGLGAVLLLFASEIRGASPETGLAPFFSPPKELADDFGGWDSPLKKPEGGDVATADEWPARRQQILRRWRMRLGDWPPPLAKPALRIVRTTHRENFTQHDVVVEVAPPPTHPAPLADAKKSLESFGHLLVPDGAGPFPAVLVPFYESLTSAGLKPDLQGHHDYGFQLAKRGYVTLSIGTPGGNETGSDTREALIRIGHDYGCQPLGFLAYVASNGWTLLSQRTEVDPTRIGIVGLSYGGKWSMFASCLDDRFACAVWGDPGILFDESNGNINYYEPWYLGYDFRLPMDRQRPRGKPDDAKPRTGLYRELIDQKQQLVDLHSLMAPRPVLVSGGTEDKVDRWTALNHLVRLNSLLGYENRVALTLRETHRPDRAAAEQTYRFFDQFLKPAAKKTERGAAAASSSAAAPAGPALLDNTEENRTLAVRKGLAIATKGAANYPSHRECFSCHHQTLPLLAMTRAAAVRRAGTGDAEPTSPFPLDRPLAESIERFTLQSFALKHDALREGTGIGGKALTVGYGLWTLKLAHHAADATTDAMVEYLLKTQEEDGHWNFHSLRPPASSSIAMTTALAVQGLQAYGTHAAGEKRVESALERAARWFRSQAAATDGGPPTIAAVSHEDRIGFEWGQDLLTSALARVAATEPAIAVNAADRTEETAEPVSGLPVPGDSLRRSQQADGGWAQEPGMASDAYATATALWIWSQVESHPDGERRVVSDPSYQRGVSWLLNTQLADGSWHVKTRAKPVQVYFDNGDPHGKDQFLSMMATSYAVAVIADAQNPAADLRQPGDYQKRHDHGRP